jgi:DNA-binding HxlR family transcriptional regulator
VRSGAQTLVLLSASRNVLVLRALAEGPKRQIDLRRAAGSPAQSTLRSHLASLEEGGAIAKQKRNAFPGALEYEMQKPGWELLAVAEALEGWLAGAPDGPLELGSDPAKAAIKALADGWSAKMLRVLAGAPLSLTEIDRVIGDLNYPSLERRLSALRIAGLVEALPTNGRGTPYAVSQWLRGAVAPLIAASDWELRNGPDGTAPLRSVDAETIFLLAVPLIRLPGDLSGTCRMAVEFTGKRGRRLAGTSVEVRQGRVRACTSKIGGKADAWVSGPPTAWLNALVEADSDRLELGGDCRLARSILETLHRLLSPASLNNAHLEPK